MKFLKFFLILCGQVLTLIFLKISFLALTVTKLRQDDCCEVKTSSSRFVELQTSVRHDPVYVRRSLAASLPEKVKNYCL